MDLCNLFRGTVLNALLYTVTEIVLAEVTLISCCTKFLKILCVWHFTVFGRNNAEQALQALNGTIIGKQQVRLSWGRNPANKQSRGDHGNQWNGFYYGAPFYNGYGYAAQFPDPTMYAAPYGAYSFYGNQQQVS